MAILWYTNVKKIVGNMFLRVRGIYICCIIKGLWLLKPHIKGDYS